MELTLWCAILLHRWAQGQFSCDCSMVLVDDWTTKVIAEECYITQRGFS